MMKNVFHICFIPAAGLVLSLTACVHDPFLEEMDMDPPLADTTSNPVDTLAPCDPEVTYFSRDVLPILVANCAQSECHDQLTREEDIVLDQFDHVRASDVVIPFEPNESEIMEVLTESDLDKRMPPAPANALSQDQIDLIATWILQGATDETCRDSLQSVCNVTNMSYAIHIAPVINTNCRSCHSGISPAGSLDLSTHMGLQAVALNGRLAGAIDHQTGFSPMPQNGNKLNACIIDQFKSWIADGALNN